MHCQNFIIRAKVSTCRMSATHAPECTGQLLRSVDLGAIAAEGFSVYCTDCGREKFKLVILVVFFFLVHRKCSFGKPLVAA
jgi:hypothetical protein